ncbi:MAG: NUDIX hydrolase [Candidatus Aenigmarchaeota archaeon]|nr:NUDIX hydrolase [Candidatus Aenigmarchaeota archaeon]
MTEQKFHVGAKALIMNDENEILILKTNAEGMKHSNPSHWDLPGGRIKEGDSLEGTLRKEIEEELGINNMEILGHFDTSISNLKIPLENETVGLLLVVYKCKLPNNISDLKLSSEHLEYKWAYIEETKELLKLKFADSFIEKLSQFETS